LIIRKPLKEKNMYTASVPLLKMAKSLKNGNALCLENSGI